MSESRSAQQSLKDEIAALKSKVAKSAQDLTASEEQIKTVRVIFLRIYFPALRTRVLPLWSNSLEIEFYVATLTLPCDIIAARVPPMSFLKVLAFFQ